MSGERDTRSTSADQPVRDAGDLVRALKRLKDFFESEIRPPLRRHAYHVGPAERRRIKARKARKAAAKRAAREER